MSTAISGVLRRALCQGHSVRRWRSVHGNLSMALKYVSATPLGNVVPERCVNVVGSMTMYGVLSRAFRCVQGVLSLALWCGFLSCIRSSVFLSSVLTVQYSGVLLMALGHDSHLSLLSEPPLTTTRLLPTPQSGPAAPERPHAS